MNTNSLDQIPVALATALRHAAYHFALATSGDALKDPLEHFHLYITETHDVRLFLATGGNFNVEETLEIVDSFELPHSVDALPPLLLSVPLEPFRDEFRSAADAIGTDLSPEDKARELTSIFKPLILTILCQLHSP